MTYDNEDDLFDEEFDFVDEDDDDLNDDDSELEADADDDSEVEDDEDEVEEKKPAPKKKSRPAKAAGGKRKSKAEATDEASDSATDSASDGASDEPSADAAEAGPAEPEVEPGPPTDHVVHLYEFGNFTRTIAREFTSEDAEAFAKEFNRTSNSHSRQAVVAGKDEEHAISVTQLNKTASG